MGWAKQKAALQSHTDFWQVTTGRSELAATLCILSKITRSDTLAFRQRLAASQNAVVTAPRRTGQKKSRRDEK